MEGNFAGEGLQTLDEDDDMLTSMARELVERLFPAPTEAAIELGADPTPAEGVPSQPQSHPLIDAALNGDPVLVFGQTATSARNSRRRAQSMVPEQGLLFQQN